jgi:adenylyl- and sulfurtransferase ThiI
VKEELILIRYGEIALKARYTRLCFENLLISNLKNAFKTEKLYNKIWRK